MWSDLFKAIFVEGPIWFRIFSWVLIFQIFIWWFCFVKISKEEQTNKTTGFDLKAKDSKITGNLALDQNTGFKVDMEKTDFTNNIAAKSQKSSQGSSKKILENEKDIKNYPSDIKSDSGVIIRDNIILNSNKGIVGNIQNTNIDHNFVGEIKQGQDVKKIENILDNKVKESEEKIKSESISRQAGYYQATAEQYAAYGIWEKAINYGYKSFCLYLEIPEDDKNPVIKTQKAREESALYICSKFNFYSSEVIKETGKDYIYFLKELLKLAKKDNKSKGIAILENEIRIQEELKRKIGSGDS